MAQHNTIARDPAAGGAAGKACGSPLQQTCTTDCATIVATVKMPRPDCALRGGDRGGSACACRRVGMPRSFWPAHQWCRRRDRARRTRPGQLGRPQGFRRRQGLGRRQWPRLDRRHRPSRVRAGRRKRREGLGAATASRHPLGQRSGAVEWSWRRATTDFGHHRRDAEPRRPKPPECPKEPCDDPGTGEPPGKPGPNFPQSGGGGGGAIEQLPRYKPPSVPEMQLPGELQPAQPGVPGGTAALEAGAGVVAAAAPVGAAVPIALPVIVAPPLGLGIGGGGGPGGAGAQAGLPPAAPRGVPAQPPAGRSSPPANVGSNAAVPNASYRIGYTEYLRTAGLPQVAALAVPGLVGIMVLTGAGGLVGYRQAKAGHSVTVGGSARFMR